VKVTINRKCCNSLLDTGSDLTLIPAKLVDKQRIYPTTQQCIAANRTKIQILGWTSITGRIGKTPIEVNGLVTEHISELMLGIDWLQKNDISWNFKSGQIILEGEVI